MWWGMVNNMRLVEIDALNIGVLGSDGLKSNAEIATNIDQLLDVVEALVRFKNVAHNQGGIVIHCCVKMFIEPRVQSCVLKYMHSMGSIKWNSSFKNSIFELGPT